MSARRRDSDIGRLVKPAAVLGMGRQFGSLVFMGVLLVLPAVASRDIVDDFVWAYFASLFLSSVLNLGLERVVGPTVARSDGVPLRDVLRPVLLARLYTVPVTLVTLWVLYRFVDVTLPPVAWALSLAWVIAIQVQGVAFAGLRAGARYRIEPRLAVASRLAEAAAVLGLGIAGASITLLVGAMACVEIAVALVAVQSLGQRAPAATSMVPDLPWKTLSLYALVEILAFAYLRVDMAIVGHILGPGTGATYGLIYRVIDALMGLATPVLLIMFPYAARMVASGDGLRALRERALSALPAAAVVLSVATLFLAAPLAAAVPRFGEGVTALRTLLVAVPLYFLNAIELHLRAAEDRNTGVLAIGAGVLALNVALNLFLVPRYGLNGAAWALCVTEGVQLVAIMVSGRSNQAVVRRWGLAVVGYAGALCVLAVLVNDGQIVAGVLVAAGLVTAAGVTAGRSILPEPALQP